MILFLDFDGVTHPEPHAPEAAFTQLPLIESVVRERVHVAIVVSSSWRESRSLDELRDFFAPDIQPRVVGVTPDLWDQALAPAYVRELECLAWLAANRPVGTRWLAIDARPLAQVMPRLAGDDANPDETEQLVIALRRANVINGPTAVALLGRYFDETRK